MKRDEAKALNKALGDAIGIALSKFVEDGAERSAVPPLETRKADAAAVARNIAGPSSPDDFEKLYAKLKARLLDDLRVDPTFVRLLAAQPEILLEIEPRRVMLDGSSLKGRVCILIAQGFLDEPKAPGQILKELARTGGQTHPARLSEALSALRGEGIVTSEDEGYRRAPGLKVTKGELVEA